MRKFKNFHGQVAHFVVRAVDHVQLQLESGDAVAEFGLFSSEDVGVDFVVDPHVDDTVLLLDGQSHLALNLGSLGEYVGLSVFGLRLQDGSDPVADLFVFDSHLLEDGQDLSVDVSFGDPRSRMSLDVVVGAAVVDVVAVAVLGAFGLLLAGDGMPAVAAGDTVACVGHFVRLVDVSAEQRLNAVPSGSVGQRFVLTGIPSRFRLAVRL